LLRRSRFRRSVSTQGHADHHDRSAPSRRARPSFDNIAAHGEVAPTDEYSHAAAPCAPRDALHITVSAPDTPAETQLCTCPDPIWLNEKHKGRWPRVEAVAAGLFNRRFSAGLRVAYFVRSRSAAAKPLLR
jgi:hypothetical protein